MIKQIIDYLGYFSTILVLISTIAAVVAWAKGIFPAILRLGNGFAKRKIAIFAKDNNLSSLESLLVDSGLFLKKNIIPITKECDFGKAEAPTLLLVYWPDWKDNLMKIKDIKKDGEALVIYSPKSAGQIPETEMTELDNKRNVMVNNFRGRLLNDLVTAMVTTSYIKN